MRTVTATRYVTPLREGGSLPAIIEADDAGLYVLKFRGAGQGVNALVAEVIVADLAQAAGLRMPEIVFVEVDADLARTEPDPEIQDLIRASAGLNVGFDYLPGAIMFDPVVGQPAADLASDIVWFDAFVMNVDRTARNANLLAWHQQLWLIDHGAALYFQHDWDGGPERSGDPFPRIRDHVLLPFADDLPAADARLRARLTPAACAAAVDSVPEVWLPAGARRSGFVAFLAQRLESSQAFLQEAVRARSQLV